MGSVGTKRWVVWQDEGGREAAARCSSFLDRNGGQVQLYVKATQGERRRHKEKDGGEGGCMMTLTSGKGHSI